MQHSVSGEGAPSLVVGRIVGLASCLVGLALFAGWVAVRISPVLGRRTFMLPYFDGPLILTKTSVLVLHLVVAVLLIGVGVLILRRHRFAPLAYIVTGWAGLLFTVIAAWPGPKYRGKIEFALEAQKNKGLLPKDTTWIDMVPTEVFVGLGVFAAVWLLLLVAGTWHLRRQRAYYDA